MYNYIIYVYCILYVIKLIEFKITAVWILLSNVKHIDRLIGIIRVNEMDIKIF